jgi:hypothetical protein
MFIATIHRDKNMGSFGNNSRRPPPPGKAAKPRRPFVADNPAFINVIVVTLWPARSVA